LKRCDAVSRAVRADPLELSAPEARGHHRLPPPRRPRGFIVIPEKDCNAMQERLEDDADFRAIEASKKRQSRSPRIPSDQVKRELGIISGRSKSKA
jgi:hypothetical protein